MPQVSIRLLGGFSLRQDDQRVELVGRRQQELLAALALHPSDGQSRSRLASLFWPEGDESQARNNLRKMIHDLRAAWPASAQLVDFGREAIGFRDGVPVSVDFGCFLTQASEARDLESTERAASLYAGQLLPECYDDWILSYREQARRVFTDLVRQGMEMAEAAGDYLRAIALGERLLEEEPLREDIHASLMRLHSLAGDRAGALHRYHACATILEQELGVEPGEEIAGFYRRLLSIHETARPAGPQAGTVQLVGRDQEWRRIQEAWRATVTGKPMAVVLRGDPGIGKTRLADELQLWAERQGATVFRTQAYEGQESEPFGAAIRMLSGRMLPTLEPRLARELSRLLSSGSASADKGNEGSSDLGWRRRLQLEAVSAVLLANQPAIVLLDDLQWCDQDTLLAIRRVFTLDRRAALLVMAMTRERSASPGEGRLLEDHGGGSLVDLELGPLSRAHTDELARSLSTESGVELAQEGFLDRVYRVTEGNPLFVIELLRAQQDQKGNVEGPVGGQGLPSLIGAAIRRRFDGLSIGARSLMGIAAAMGRDFELAVLSHASHQKGEELVRNIDELWRKRIIRERGRHAYDFTHGRLRDVAYDLLTNAQKSLDHRLVAESYVALRRDGSAITEAEIARHFERAGDEEEAAGWYVKAAESALRVYANEAAIAYFEQALELGRGRDPEVLLRMGAILQTTGRWERAAQLFTAALRLAEGRGDRVLAARAKMATGDMSRLQSKFDDALRWFERARHDLDAVDAPSVQAQLCSLCAEAYLWTPDYQKARSEAEAQLDWARRAGDLVQEAAALRNLGTAALRQTRLEDALGFGLQSLELEERLGNHPGLLLVLGQLAMAYRLRGDLHIAEGYAERQLALARRVGHIHLEATALHNLSMILEEQGRFDEARPPLERSVAISREIGALSGAASGLGNLGIIHYDLGETPRALALLCESFRVKTEIGEPRNAAVLLGGMGGLFAYVGDFEGAASCLLASLKISAEIGNRQAVLEDAGFIAEMLLAMDRRPEATKIGGLCVDLGRRLGMHALVARDLDTLAEIALMEGRDEEAGCITGRALDIARGSRQEGVVFKGLLRQVKLALRSGATTRSDARTQAQGILRSARSDRERAEGAFALWNIDPESAELRAEAESMCREFYLRSHEIRFAGHLRALGATVPDLPPITTDPPLDDAGEQLAPDQVEAILRGVLQDATEA